MKKNIIILPLLALSACVYMSFKKPSGTRWNEDSSLSEVLAFLGSSNGSDTITMTEELTAAGEDIFFKGKTKMPDGSSTKVQSLHYVCSNCHITSIEYPAGKANNADARLELAMNTKVPYLQGSTMYGITNRKSWYNDDYIKKYGSLVENARDTLQNAIQLCATECSQGRALSDWEMKAMMSYLKSIEVKLGDLELTDSQMTRLNSAEKNSNNSTIISLLETRYPTKSAATFVDPLALDKQLNGEGGNEKNGAYIYKEGCQTCHHDERIAGTILEDNKVTHRMLWKNMAKSSDWNIYHICREGTYPKPGYRPYMPNYTTQKLSDKQLNDLAAYIKKKAKL